MTNNIAFYFIPAFRANKFVKSVAAVTTVIELTGMRIAAIRGDS
jgi:hypothetical protein